MRRLVAGLGWTLGKAACAYCFRHTGGETLPSVGLHAMLHRTAPRRLNYGPVDQDKPFPWPRSWPCPWPCSQPWSWPWYRPVLAMVLSFGPAWPVLFACMYTLPCMHHVFSRDSVTELRTPRGGGQRKEAPRAKQAEAHPWALLPRGAQHGHEAGRPYMHAHAGLGFDGRAPGLHAWKA